MAYVAITTNEDNEIISVHNSGVAAADYIQAKYNVVKSEWSNGDGDEEYTWFKIETSSCFFESLFVTLYDVSGT